MVTSLAEFVSVDQTPCWRGPTSLGSSTASSPPPAVEPPGSVLRGRHRATATFGVKSEDLLPIV